MAIHFLTLQCRSAADSDDDLFSSPPKIPKTKTSRARPKQRKAPAAKVKKEAPELDSPVVSEDSEAEDNSLFEPALREEGTPVPQRTCIEDSGAEHAQPIGTEASAQQTAIIVAQEPGEGAGDGWQLISGIAKPEEAIGSLSAELYCLCQHDFHNARNARWSI